MSWDDWKVHRLQGYRSVDWVAIVLVVLSSGRTFVGPFRLLTWKPVQ
jgi:hypothetical protein